MKFILDRSSGWGHNEDYTANTEPPAEYGAKMETVTEIDRRAGAYLSQFKYAREEWFSRGKNHRTEDGYAVRDRETVMPVIEIDTLEALMDCINKWGKVVIQPPYSYSLPTLEIYDDYRE